MDSPLLVAAFGTTILSLAIIVVCVLLIGLILLQKNRGAGLSGAFGGVGGHSAFGTKTGDVMTWITVGLAAVFLLLSIVGNYVFAPTRMPSAVALPAPEPSSPAPASPSPVQAVKIEQPPAPVGVETSPPAAPTSQAAP